METKQISYQSAIKKNLIDLLMFSLYPDARTIYREYVQNALDSINMAVSQSILNQSKDGVVNINIDKRSRTIVILDNGTGISSEVAVQRLLDISSSTKDGVTAAGQFGIGRLVGGGYCHKLIFKTSAKGEAVATVVTFDVDRIEKMVKVDSENYLATYVMDTCTTKEIVAEKSDNHYFEVSLCDVKNDVGSILLESDEVIKYLNEVAPVGYSSQFSNGVIYHSLKENPGFEELHEQLEKVQVFVGGHKIEKQYGLKIEGTGDEIDRLEYFKIESDKFGMLARGWFALTKYTIQISKDDPLQGIRLRKHNIQIGEKDLLSGQPLWKEQRGNSYFYGELFVTNPNIMPTAAREGLAPTPEKIALYDKLRELFKDLHGLYTKANAAKKAIDRIKEGTESLNKTTNANECRIAIDKIDNKGIRAFDTLVNNVSYDSLKHMLGLYAADYQIAKAEAQKAKDKYSGKPSTPVSTPQGGGQLSKSPAPPITPAPQPTTSMPIPSGIVGGTTMPTGNVTTTGMPTPQSDGNAIPTTPTQNPVAPNSGLQPIALKPAERLGTMQVQNKLAALNGKIDDSELWTLRRVFRVLNTYCPQNERDLHLIETLENEIVSDFLKHE